jgi:hypothetical protein
MRTFQPAPVYLAVAVLAGSGLVVIASPGDTFSPADPAPAVVQKDEGLRVFYINGDTMIVPYNADANVRKVLLYVSDDGGKTYDKAALGDPRADKPSFSYKAPRDGVYCFTLQAVDAKGRRLPPTLEEARPQLKVCFDTQPPMVRLKAVPRQSGVAVKWGIWDENLDVETLELDYRVVGTEEWQTLPVKQRAAGEYSWKPATGERLEVRLRVADKAHNYGETRVIVEPGKGK